MPSPHIVAASCAVEHYKLPRYSKTSVRVPFSLGQVKSACHLHRTGTWHYIAYIWSFRRQHASNVKNTALALQTHAPLTRVLYAGTHHHHQGPWRCPSRGQHKDSRTPPCPPARPPMPHSCPWGRHTLNLTLWYKRTLPKQNKQRNGLKGTNDQHSKIRIINGLFVDHRYHHISRTTTIPSTQKAFVGDKYTYIWTAPVRYTSTYVSALTRGTQGEQC